MKTDRKFILLIMLLLSFLMEVNGQVLERQLISSYGKLSKTPTLQVSSTGGELMIQTIKNPGLILTQGFQQPGIEELVGNPYISDKFVEVIVSPNPSMYHFTMRFITGERFPASFLLLDQSGRLFVEATPFLLHEAAELRIDCSGWEAGIYYLLLRDAKNQLIEVLKIEKL